MHLHFERNTNAKCDCSILSLSWMGKVPDELPEDEGWKLNRTNYYQEGWLATGNIRGIVGVTFTTSHCKKNMDFPLRTNYNLRGHRSDVILVKWNEPYQKLASCDSSGIIFVWIKYEGRWSIELINDRNTPVTHFAWSHDGRMALICYQDGFVLVGSVAGQRYWSSMLNLEATITCGIWTPDDQQVYFGTTQGQIIVMDVHGAMVSQVQLNSEVGITGMAWSCEKFKMEEGEDTEPGVTNAAKRSFVLAISFQNGFIYLLKSYDDVSPIHIDTNLGGGVGLVMEWSNSRELLAVAGSGACAVDSVNGASTTYKNVLKFYTDTGALLYCAAVPHVQTPVSALTWGHNDKRIFIATGTQVHIAWISRRVASLQLLSRLQVQRSLRSETHLSALPLPTRIKSLIGNLFAQTIRCCVPDITALRDFVARPPAGSVRLHCTMIRHDDDNNASSGTCYTLYLEYLGGLVPLLKGKRTSKIRPEFVIFDPQADESRITIQSSPDSGKSSGSSNNTTSMNGATRSESSDSEPDDGCRGSPMMPRRRKARPKTRRPERLQQERAEAELIDELAYVDTLPEEIRLVEVTSNIWGTKFKIHGLAKTVPANLGQVTYKTSLLHLQPRQMTLVMTELRDDFPMGPDPTFNPNLFSEDEEDSNPEVNTRRIPVGLPAELSPPIAPMSPLANRFSRTRTAQNHRNCEQPANPATLPALARAESYEDEFPYVDLSEMVTFCESLRQNGVGKMYGDASNSQNSVRSSNTATISHQGPSYTSIVGQYARGNASSGCSGGVTQSRHAISPLCCEGSVPTLQSPKNAVAPSDIIFDRPPAQALMSYSATTDYSNNIQQVKSALIAEHSHVRSTTQVNGLPLNLNLNLEHRQVRKFDNSLEVNANKLNITNGNVLVKESSGSRPVDSKIHKRKDIKPSPSGQLSSKVQAELQFIDEEAQFEVSTTLERTAVARMRRTPTVVSISPACLDEAMVRSCSVGYLDSVDAQMVPCDVALTMLRKETPKRLVLVNTKNKRRSKRQDAKQQKNATTSNTLKLRDCGKSKSLDSSDIFHIEGTSNINPLPNHIEEPNVSSNNDYESIANLTSAPISKEPLDIDIEMTTKEVPKLSFFTSSKTPTMSRREYPRACTTCKCVTATTSTVTSTCHSLNSDITTCNACRVSQHTPRSGEQNNKKSKRFGNRNDHQDNMPAIDIMPLDSRTAMSLHTHALATLEHLLTKIRDMDDTRSTPPNSPVLPPRLPRSSPASPAPSKKGKRNQSASPIRKHILNSPLLNRRLRKNKATESSDDEIALIGEEIVNSKNYRDLETFQKAQLRQKLKRGKIEPNGSSSGGQPAPLRREFVMHNKAPMWNESSQVYQLDFGGRVTQESAKNFQIEFRGKQVMQFGRIDGNAYTLDFQYPFSALQAFAVALANVTQRLK